MTSASRELSRASDEELLRLVVRGDRSPGGAWSVLVARITPRLYAVARSFRLDAATCDDLVQTAWLRLIERADQLRDPGSVGPWMAMVVRNEARKLVTRTRTVPIADGWERIADESIGDPDGRLAQRERDASLRSAFARLGEECRQLIQLSLADPPLTYDEIAAAVGRPRGSLGPTRRRCLERLRAMLPTGLFEP